MAREETMVEEVARHQGPEEFSWGGVNSIPLLIDQVRKTHFE